MQDGYDTRSVILFNNMADQVVSNEESKFNFGLNKDQEEQANILHKSSVVVDFHEHPYVFPLPRERYFNEYCSLGRLIIGYEGLEAGGLNAIFAGVHFYCRVSQRRPWTWYDLVYSLGIHHTDTLKQKDRKFFVGKTSNDINLAKKEGRIAIFPTSEYGDVIGNELDNLDVLYGLGLRGLGLTYFHQNQIGGAELDPDAHLTDFGFDAIKRMNDLGMLFDLSHTNYHTTLEAIQVSEKPCVISHGMSATKTGLSTYKSDEEIIALAEKGGVFGLKIHGLLNIKKDSPATINDALDHIDHLIDLVGADHVAIGPDTEFGGETHYIMGYKNVSQFFNITRGLISRGYSKEEIQNIIGGSVVRVMAEIEN
jgi:membrane dipeptidase